MSRVIVESARETPVFGEFDVAVVGGGPAGIVAATAAARAGRSTILVERYGFLGGAGTAAGLSTFCGLHANVAGEHRRVVRGLCDEILERLEKMDALNPPHLSVQNRIQAQAYDISAYKIAADEMLLAAGAKLLFHAFAVAVAMKSEREAIRLIHAAIERGHDVNVFAYEGAVAVPFARQSAHANAVHGRDEGDAPPPCHHRA